MFLTPVFWIIVLPALGTSFALLHMLKNQQEQKAKPKPAEATITKKQ